MDPLETPEPLTAREHEVLDLMARGLTNGEIAANLGIAFETAKWHVSNVIAKLGVATREEAVHAWRKHQSLRGRASRAINSLLLGPAAIKAAGLVAGVAIIAGALSVTAAFVLHNGPGTRSSTATSPAAAPASQPTPALEPPDSPGYTVLDSFVVDSTTWELVAATPGDGHWLCSGVRPAGDVDALQGPAACGPAADMDDLAWSLIFIASAGQRSHDIRIAWGSTGETVASVDATLPGGQAVAARLVEPQPGLATNRRFFAIELPAPLASLTLNAYAADGSLLDSVTYPRRDDGLLDRLWSLLKP